MTFGPNSTNPRERRAYADAMLARASASGTIEDYEAARAAIVSAGDSAKSRRAGFRERLASAALSEKDTRIIVELGRQVLDPRATPPVDGLCIRDLQLRFQEYGSSDFVRFRRGVAAHRAYGERLPNGVVEHFGNLTIADHGINREGYVIPLADYKTVDVLAVRALPDQVRSEMASLALRIVHPL